MNQISQETAEILYGKVTEIDEQKGLAAKEKIPKLRSVLDSLFKELTKDEKQFFSDLFSRTIYIFDKYKIDREIIEKIHALRRLANKVIHEVDWLPEENDYLASLNLIAEVINYFSKIPIPETFQGIITGSPDLGIKTSVIQEDELIPFVTAIILSVAKNQQNDREYVYLNCTSEEMGLFTLVLMDYYAPSGQTIVKYTELADLVWKYSKVNLFTIEKIKGKDKFYSTTDKSFIVLEPDYLLDASKIAECFQVNGENPLLYLLNKFKKGEPSEAMLLGNIVNRILDDVIVRPKTKFEHSFEMAIRDSMLPFLSVSCSNSSFDFDNMKQKAKMQMATICECAKEYANHSIHIEPTFISPMYGLQGRLDILTEGKDDDNRKNIIELKSGAVPDNSVWINHAIQAECYNMLIESAFPGRKGMTSILYSKANSDGFPLRYLNESLWNKQKALRIRNRIVANEYKLANNNYDAIFKIKPQTFGVVPRFDISTVNQFDDILNGNSTTDLERKYFLTFISFIAREQRAAKIGSNIDDGDEGFAGLWKSTLEEKRANYTILDELEIESISDNFELTLKRKGTLFTNPISNFREGDIGILYPTISEDSLNPLRTKILKCVINGIDNSDIKITLRNKQVDKAYFNKFSRWAIEHDLLENNFDAMYKSLYRFLCANSQEKELLLGLKKPAFSIAHIRLSDPMTPDMRSLLERALSASDYFLVQGPPGTGKTSIFLIGLVKNLINATDENIIILAFTNRAINEICYYLKTAGLSFLKIGKKEAREENNWSTLLKEKTLQEIYKTIEGTRIFVSTQASFASNLEILKLKSFSTAIIDEASQLLEPHLIGILPEFKRFVLIGDDKQLPAIVIQKDAEVKDNDLTEIGITNLKDSLFSRLYKNCENKGWNEAVGMLTNQGRMHEDIAEFVNNEYYGGKLKSISPHQKVKEHRFAVDSFNIYEKVISSARVVFIPTKRESKSKRNDHEAMLVGALVKTIKDVYQDDFNEGTVGVITPYRAQIANIILNGGIPPDLQKQITIDTVERYQGSQRDIIIISFAVNYAHQLDLLESLTSDGKVDRKLNVALTRAKNHLIILGCPAILTKKPIYGKLIDFIKLKGGYIQLGVV
ncbi:MAG: AAA domain-containing protein [Proteobacteria bacterium]|nr:AAA domain-containing protein [Pseudomonadota bacterium]